MSFEAIVRPSEVMRAVDLFQQKVEFGCSDIGGFPRGRTTWNARLGFWSHFQSWKRQDNTERYWNTFGFERDNIRRRVMVEINPPVKNLYATMQGVVARAKDGSLWILHRGSLSIPGKRITEDEFEFQTQLKRELVLFPKAREVSCNPVVCLDDDEQSIQQDLRHYVSECRKIRHYFMYGAKIAKDEAKLATVDGQPIINPELTDEYNIPPQGAKTIERKHGKIWNALTGEISKARHEPYK